MSYVVTILDPGIPWFNNALLFAVDKYRHLWPHRFRLIPESVYCEWWTIEYGYLLTIDDTDEDEIKWMLDFADEKEYLMFLLRWL